MNRIIRLMLALLVFAAPGTALAQEGGAPPAPNTIVHATAAPVTVNVNGRARATVHLVILSGWHINANPPALDYNVPTKVWLKSAFGVSATKPVYPAAKQVKLALEEQPLLVYTTEADVALPISADGDAVAGAHTLHGTVEYQACDDRVCLQPTSVPFDLDVTVTGGGAAAPGGVEPTATDTAATGDTASTARGAGFMTGPPVGAVSANDRASQGLQAALAKGGFWWFLKLFGGGLLLNLTPCVFPMLGITVSIFGARRKQPLPRVLAQAIAYVLGICVMYSVLGVAAGLTGGLFGSALQNPLVSVGLGLLLGVLSLSMFGVYEMQAPTWVLDRAGVANTGTVIGIFLSGLAVGVIAAPCIGPLVVALLAVIAQRGSALFGLKSMFALALGLGFPYLFLATFSNLLQRLPRSGEWMEWVKKFFGVLLASLGLYYVLIGVAPTRAPWVLPAALMLGGLYLGFMEKSANDRGRFRLMKRVAGAAGVVAAIVLVLQMTSARSRGLVFEPYDEKSMRTSLAGGRGVILDFSADWCFDCHQLERHTFPDPGVIAAARGFDAYRVDLTHYQTPEADQWRRRYHIAGLPTVVFLDPHGNEVPAARIEGFVPPADFVRRLALVAMAR